ncbi:MAG TPA: amidohydrolase family protein [Sorangium sp.]|nr:amidohydrolase family protein [Sorangium sp.]
MINNEVIRAAAARWRAPAPSTADLIFVNGTFLLAEPTVTGEDVTAIAVAGETIVDVGDADRITREARPGAVTIDLGGDTLAPGFVEAHAHIVAASQTVYSVDLRYSSPTLDTYEKVLARIAKEIGEQPEGSWCFFMNFDPSLLAFDKEKGFPQLGFDVLDALPNSDKVNVFVENASGHIAYGNSKAFSTCGITDQHHPDPADGGWYDFENGHLTGVMFEPPTFSPFLGNAHPKPPAVLEAMLGFLRAAHLQGVTTVADPAVGIGGNLELELAVYHLMATLPIWTDVVGSIDLTSLYPPDGQSPQIEGLLTPARAGATGSYKALVIPAVKLWADGSTQGYTGFLTEDYLPPVTPEGLRKRTEKGEADWKPKDMIELIQRARNDNWGMLIHANGDKGLDLALESIRAVYREGSGFRNRIEHCTVARSDQYDTMKLLGVTPTYLTNHIAIWGDTFRDNILGAARAERIDAVREALDRGMPFSFHCDYATSLPVPLQYMQTAITRQTGSGAVLGEDLGIDALEALKGVTIYPAQQLGLDDTIGTLAAGKRANLVRLGANPLSTPASQLTSIPVVGTWVRGRAVPME